MLELTGVSAAPESPAGGVQRVGGVRHAVARGPGRGLRPEGRRDGVHDGLPQGR